MVTEEKVQFVSTPMTHIKVDCPVCSEELTIPILVEDGGLNDDGDHILNLVPHMDITHRHIGEHVLDPEKVYVFPQDKGNQLDIVVDDLLVLVKRTDDGVVIDVYPNSDSETLGEPYATTYAFFGEGNDE